MNEKQFVETYCCNCGTQRCEGIGTEWFEGCRYRWNLDGMDAAAEINRLKKKCLELSTKILCLQEQILKSEEVKYAEWIPYELPYGVGYSTPNYKPTHYCSNCQGLGWEFYGKCPRCGAIMNRGEVN